MTTTATSIMPTFDFEFTVDATVKQVSDFHSDTAALKVLTPPPTIVQLHEIEPLAEGSRSSFTLWVGPLPLRWTALHRDVGPNGFTDLQTDGPAQKWVHTHTFTPLGAETTRVNEHIEFEHKPGFRGLVTRLLFARLNLYVMFTYRRWVTRRVLHRRRQSAD